MPDRPKFWTHTMRGRAVNMFAPTMDDVNLFEVALSLGNSCRYNGCVSYFYSIAEHSVLLADYLGTMGYSREEQLAALLHDAAEAYTGDITWPVQAVLWDAAPEARVAYKAMQRRFNVVICAHAGIPVEMLDLEFIHEADLRILLNERDALLEPNGVKWYGEEKGLTPLRLPGIEGWNPVRASQRYLTALQRCGVDLKRLAVNFLWSEAG